MKRPLLLTLSVLLLVLMTSACYIPPPAYVEGQQAEPEPEIIAMRAPPEMKPEEPGEPPQVGWFWRGGYWHWHGDDYQWVGGRWVPPQEGEEWAPPAYEPRGEGEGRRWVYRPPRWRHRRQKGHEPKHEPGHEPRHEPGHEPGHEPEGAGRAQGRVAAPPAEGNKPPPRGREAAPPAGKGREPAPPRHREPAPPRNFELLLSKPFRQSPNFSQQSSLSRTFHPKSQRVF